MLIDAPQKPQNPNHPLHTQFEHGEMVGVSSGQKVPGFLERELDQALLERNATEDGKKRSGNTGAKQNVKGSAVLVALRSVILNGAVHIVACLIDLLLDAAYLGEIAPIPSLTHPLRRGAVLAEEVVVRRRHVVLGLRRSNGKGQGGSCSEAGSNETTLHGSSLSGKQYVRQQLQINAGKER